MSTQEVRQSMFLKLARSPAVAWIAKPVARSIPQRWLKLLPPKVLNATNFSGVVHVHLLPGRSFLMHADNTTTDVAANGIRCDGGEALNCFLSLLPHVRTFLDVGSNTGIYSVMAA